MVQLSHLYMTPGKTIALTVWTFVAKVMPLLFNTVWVSRFVIAFVPRGKPLLISWLWSPTEKYVQALLNPPCAALSQQWSKQRLHASPDSPLGGFGATGVVDS